MPRRCNDHLFHDEPLRKRSCNATPNPNFDLRNGECLKDLTGKRWTLGRSVGVGGFGQIYLASDKLHGNADTESSFVAKIESHTNGPLFVEVNCYLRIAKQEMIDEFMEKHNLKALGMPHYVASGSHKSKSGRFRFLILPRFDRDLEQVLQDKKVLNLKTVLMISSQIMDVLNYIHGKGYIHSDVKASNILLRNRNDSSPERAPVKPLQKPLRSPRCPIKPIRSCRLRKPKRSNFMDLRPQAIINYREDSVESTKSDPLEQSRETSVPMAKNDNDQVYLLDYGLASKFLASDGSHKPFCVDERKAHAGTILFCSRDAHKGISSRRSDLESLGYNMVFWLTGSLPWAKDYDNPELVERRKQKAFAEPEAFLRSCFNGEHPKFLLEFFRSLKKLQFAEKPDYNRYKKLFRQTLKEYGYKDDQRFDFDNLHGWGKKQKRINKRKSENKKTPMFVYKITRPPLQSNIPIRPLLRKKIKNPKLMNWSKILLDPEVILKQGKTKKSEPVESADLTKLDLQKLKPTPAMVEVFNRSFDKTITLSNNVDNNIDGYTPAMMSVLERIKQRKLLENSAVNTTSRNCETKRRRGRPRKIQLGLESLIKTRNNNKSMVVKREVSVTQGRKLKHSASARSYTLRG